jgi:hypothetical protein
MYKIEHWESVSPVLMTRPDVGPEKTYLTRFVSFFFMTVTRSVLSTDTLTLAADAERFGTKS